ncbi:MAG: sulfatase, partial [Planctomycetota bacterium]
PKDWNVVMIVLDTLRADGLGCYGNPRPVSPRLDAFAAGGILFENAWAVSPGTASSHASMFSSTYPETHGVWNREIHDGETTGGHALSPEVTTLAEAFQEAGFFTGAIADGGFVSEARGMDQGFDYFESFTRGGPAIFRHAGKWLDRHAEDEDPFFLFVHTYETHVPFVPLPEDLAQIAGDYQGPMRDAYEAAYAESEGNERKRKKQTTQAKFFRKLVQGELTQADKDFYRVLYDAEVLLTDRLVGELLDRLELLGLRENTLILITSDHGEEFWEHGRHGHTQVYEPLLHIPLLVSLPGGPQGVRREDGLDHVDFMPSLLDALGIAKPDTAMGRIVDLAAIEGPQDERWMVGQNNYPTAQTAVRRGAQKWIGYEDPERGDEVFDLTSDPLELRNVLEQEGSTSFLEGARLFMVEWRRRCLAWGSDHGLKAIDRGASRQMPDRTQRELEQLGYIGDDE